MSRKRIYPKTNGYFVYAHITPNGMIYIGMSKRQPCQRWRPSMYQDNSLAPYITEYGWQNIEHKVLIDGLTKKEAEQWEDRLIQALSMNGMCINERRSGGIERDNKQTYKNQWDEDHKEEIKAYQKQYRKDHKEEIKAYDKQYYEDHKEYHKAYKKQLRSTIEGKIYNRVSNYNRNHTPIETPSEAKQKYLETGYIPNYIKNNDLK